MQTSVNSNYLVSIVSGGVEQHWQTPGETWKEVGETALNLAQGLPEYSAVEIDRVLTKTIGGELQPPVTENIFSWNSENPMTLENAIGVTFLSS